MILDKKFLTKHQKRKEICSHTRIEKKSKRESDDTWGVLRSAVGSIKIVMKGCFFYQEFWGMHRTTVSSIEILMQGFLSLQEISASSLIIRGFIRSSLSMDSVIEEFALIPITMKAVSSRIFQYYPVIFLDASLKSGSLCFGLE